MSLLRISLLATLAFALSSLTASAQELATAKVVEVTGTVTKYLENGDLEPLEKGDLLREGDAVSVTALSSAKLVFSNGSEMTINENTSINLATLQQESFAGGKSYEQLKADPSTSQTLIELNYGSLSGHVKKLRKGSNFNIQTPLGTAAIRGTKWETFLIYNAERQEFLFSTKNLDGAVDIISRYVGSVEYGSGNVGDKSYESSLTEDVREAIPANHTVIIRIGRTDPAFDDLVKLIQNYQSGDPDPQITPDDFGIIVVSPEGPGGP